jgi:hypothetical protein
MPKRLYLLHPNLPSIDLDSVIGGHYQHCQGMHKLHISGYTYILQYILQYM